MQKTVSDQEIKDTIANHIDRISGGAGDSVDPRNFDIEELSKGIREEAKEHADDLGICLELVLDHLVNDPKYYSNGKNEVLQEVRSLRKTILEDGNIEVKHVGLLEIPEGNHFWDLPISHYEALVKKHGKDMIIRALTNIEVWNKKTNPDISKKAIKIKEAL